MAPLIDFARSVLPAATEGPEALARADPPALPLPAFPKPSTVLAAEERERKRKEKVSLPLLVDTSCYSLNNSL